MVQKNKSLIEEILMIEKIYFSIDKNKKFKFFKKVNIANSKFLISKN